MASSTARPVPKPYHYLRVVVYGLATVLGFALLSVGTVAVIAEVKGSWHWAIHVESTVSYIGVFVGWLLVVLLPLTVGLLIGRLRYE